RGHFFFERNQGVGEGGKHAYGNAILASELHRTDLQHLGAERRHFQHFLEGNDIHAAGFGNDAGVGGIDAVNIGEDQAFVCLQSGGNRHGGGIGTATPQRGDVAFVV